MVTTALQDKPTPEPADVASAGFDRDASRDLVQIEAAIDNLREAWRVLTPLGRRHTFGCGLILEIAAMLGDLASEQRRIEEEAGI